ncbi:MAG: PH domain-containing protein [Planctomycetota bacterium]|nr:PH domain-containing protein [Planctomycetota bacterium]
MSLSSDEHVIYSTRFSKRLFVKPFLVSVVTVVVAFMFSIIAAEYAHYLFWALIALAVLSLVSPFTKYWLSQFVVTNQRVIIRHGFLARTTYEMILKKIESISVAGRGFGGGRFRGFRRAGVAAGLVQEGLFFWLRGAESRGGTRFRRWQRLRLAW